MKRICAILVAFLLSGCGGGGGSSIPRQPALIPAQALNAPVIYRRDGVQIGGDVRPSRSRLSPAGTHGGAAVSSGRIRDGESAERVRDYLDIHAFHWTSGDVELATFNMKPVIRIRESTSDRFIDDIVKTVQLINIALPHEHRITISSERAQRSAVPDCVGDTCTYRTNYVPHGQIFVGVGPQREWPIYVQTDVGRELGVTDTAASIDGRGAAATVWVDSEVAENNPAYIRIVLAHEILHALGMSKHPELKDFQSVMNTFVPWDRTNQAYHLETIDVDGLHALYTRFYDGSFYVDYDPNDLGPWTDVSFHLRGDIDDVSFGASSRNGLIQPWAHGPSPETNLADNQALSGSASWSGRLLGFTSESESLAGATDMTINLSTLRGRIDFTGLEHWGVNATPRPIGSGTMWNDGDLRYSVIVRGNTFNQTGGDAGEVTGAFFGARHEGMGGVVERIDMSAGFGGTR